jgi:glyoxylase I family protein
MHLHHLAFRTTRLQALRDFYVEVLGFEERLRGVARASSTASASIWLSAGTAILMLEERALEEPALGRGSLELVAFRVTRAEREQLVERLERAQIALDGETAYTTYVRDPDGRRIGFSHYPNAA